MSIATVSYFHSASLRQRFLDDLHDAVRDGHLLAEEQVWLQCVTHTPDAEAEDPVRVDRLIFSDGAHRPFELAAAMMLSHALTDTPRVYLHTLANGIEAFDSRSELLTALRTRFAQGNADALFEYEKIDGDPFTAQMLAIVEHEVAQVRQQTAQLRLTPSLLEVSTESLTRQLRQLLAHLAIDANTHLLQVAPIDDGDAEPDLVVKSLAQAAFDDSCKVVLEAGYERKFLDAQGLLATTGDRALFTQAFVATQAGLQDCYRELLTAYWSGLSRAGQTRRALAIDSFESSLRREVYGHSHDGPLHVDTQSALLTLLRADSQEAFSSTELRCHRMVLTIGDGARCPLAGTFVVKPMATTSAQLLWFSSDHRLLHFADMAALTAYLTSPEGRDQLRPMLALVDQAILKNEGALQIELQDIQTPLCAERVDSIIALQARNLDYVMGLSCATDKRSAMVDDALDVRQLLDPRQWVFGSGRWKEGLAVDFARTWLKPVADELAPVVPVVEPAASSDPVSAEDESLTALTPASITPAIEATTDETATVQTAPDGTVAVADQTGSDRSQSASWVEFAQAFDARAARLQQLNNGLAQCAGQVLQEYLCVLLDRTVDVPSVHIQWLESTPVDTSDVENHTVSVSESLQAIRMDGVSLLLECVSGHRSMTLPASARLKLDPGLSSPHLEVELLSHMLGKCADGFKQRYLDEFTRSRRSVQRQDDQQLMPYQQALDIRQDAIRLDLSLAKRQARIDSTAVTMARQVLDRPVRALRLALGVPVTEAYSVSLSFQEGSGAVLSDVLVFREPLDPTSPVLLWSCTFGWRQFRNLERLKNTLRFNLAGENRERWLTLLGEKDQASLSAQLMNPPGGILLVELNRIEGHVMQTLQDRAQLRQRQDLQQLCVRATRCRVEASLFTRLAASTELDWPLIESLDGLSVRIDNSVFEAMLPSWVGIATVSELMDYYIIFKRYYETSEGGKDFLFDIPTLLTLARERLTEKLARDFPDKAFNPDHITVTSRRYISAFPSTGEVPSGVPAATEVRSESLTFYAINRFVDAQDAALSISSSTEPHAAALLTPDYVRSLIRSVDVGAAYTAVLRRAFTPDDEHYATRKRLFVNQLPSALMAVALPEKVQGRLSHRAYDFIARVLNMPDGIAREPIDDTWVILSQLQLVADEGMSPDPVTGVYVICPAAVDAGPVVLYAVYHKAFVFREYTSREALMEDIRKDESLQQLLLERMDPELHRRYAHGGFVEPHLPFSVEGFNDLPLRRPGPVTLAISEIKGNALQVLFSGTLQLLLDMGVSNSVTNAQEDHAGRSFLATLALSQTLALLPSKLSALVTLWQSHTLLRASAVSASGHRWGKALSEFTAALGVLVTAREQTLEEAPSEEQGQDQAAAVEQAEVETPTFSWSQTSLTPEQRIRLQGLEAQNVELDEMRHDALLNLYFDKEDATPYAVVAGRVYQVKRLPEQGQWKVVGGDGSPGPHLLLGNDQHWQLDLNARLRGGGGAVTRFLDATASASADEGLVIEASGMAEIRRTYRFRAQRIGEAHMQASHYLETCLDNLNATLPDGTLDPRVQRIIGDYFGVASPDQALLSQVKHAVKTLLDALMDASLSPLSSSRFVVGSNRPGRGNVTAFVIPLDPQKRLFLTNHFFRPPRYRLKPEAMLEGFETTQHFQAATLIHELSHLVLDTKDIAYLESNAPYLDLLREDTASAVRTRAHVERMQDYRFSHRTPKGDLFTQNDDGHWRDVQREDGLGYATVLRITGGKTLDEARTIFLADADKRSQIMLRNADSVALLILRLGRRNYTALIP